MKVCEVRNVKIGEGKPKICLPIVGKNDDKIIEQANSFIDEKFDVVELRIDFYENIFDDEMLLNMLKKLRKVIQQPILLTYRSKNEGGEIQLTDNQYIHLIEVVCKSGYIDLVDIELMSGNALVYRLVEIAHKNNIKVIMSNHDFNKTPDNETLMERLDKMEAFDADICKIAVMPNNNDDVVRLLNVTYTMSNKLTKPLITMSMSSLGVISRICGETFGSSLTFATKGKASAPGQINVDEMNEFLEVLSHD
jgi:3-dehydroquinate dehydratase-1